MKIISNYKRAKKDFGFTLIETLVVVGITGALMTSVTLLFKNIFVDTRQDTAALSSIDQARAVASNFVNEVRNATYGADASFALGEAGDFEMIIFTPYHSATGTINRIRYYVCGTSLCKGVTAPSGTPATYAATGSASEKIYKVLDNITNGAVTPAFYYYDGNYAGTGTSLSEPVNVNTVKFIQLNLIVLKQDIARSTVTFTVNDGVALRNLKTNLGN